jgi:hypothetical protein
MLKNRTAKLYFYYITYHPVIKIIWHPNKKIMRAIIYKMLCLDYGKIKCHINQWKKPLHYVIQCKHLVKLIIMTVKINSGGKWNVNNSLMQA